PPFEVESGRVDASAELADLPARERCLGRADVAEREIGFPLRDVQDLVAADELDVERRMNLRELREKRDDVTRRDPRRRRQANGAGRLRVTRRSDARLDRPERLAHFLGGGGELLSCRRELEPRRLAIEETRAGGFLERSEPPTHGGL